MLGLAVCDLDIIFAAVYALFGLRPAQAARPSAPVMKQRFALPGLAFARYAPGSAFQDTPWTCRISSSKRPFAQLAGGFRVYVDGIADSVFRNGIAKLACRKERAGV